MWLEFCKIAFAKTITYSEIAINIENKNAMRVVGYTCAANKIAIIIPYHKAISSSGCLSGYKCSVVLKKQLLLHENAISS